MPSAAKSTNGEVVVIWNHGGRDEADDERLANIGANDQDSEAEGRDDELGADHAARDARDGLAISEVEDEAGGKQDGEQDKGADIELAAVGGLDGTGLGGGGVLGHGENPFGRGCKRKAEARDANAIGLEIEKGPRSKPEAFQSPRAQKQA